MKRIIFTILILVPLVFLTTCKKHHSSGGSTPEDTDNDYFECKINGVQWAGHLDHINLFYYCACDSTLNIIAYRTGDGIDQSITLVSTEAVLNDTGNVIGSPEGGYLMMNFAAPNGCLTSKYYSYPNGKLFLQENNTENHYLKGTFWINGRSPNCPTDTVMEITEGRFLMHY